MTWGSCVAGDVLVRREILKGHVWCGFPVYVVEDREDLLAAYLAPGSPLAFPAWPFDRWEHPWQTAGHTSWSGHGKLMLHRPGDAYSVDLFWRGEAREFSGWYLNLQDPLRRSEGIVDTLDHELDYWIPAGQAWQVKDAELFEQRVDEERYTADEAAEIRGTAAGIETMLEAGMTWWDHDWSRWSPPEDWGALDLPEDWVEQGRSGQTRDRDEALGAL